MSMELEALAYLLPHLVQLTRVLGHPACGLGIGRVAVLAYADHELGVQDVLQWSGWTMDLMALAQWVRCTLRSQGGGGSEAAKTAAAALLKECSRPTLAVWYTDQPPHNTANCTDVSGCLREERALTAEPGGTSDWVELGKRLAAKHVVVNPLMFRSVGMPDMHPYYALMSMLTGGCCMHLWAARESKQIGQITVGLLLRLAGHDFEFGWGVEEVRLDLQQPQLAAALSTAAIREHQEQQQQQQQGLDSTAPSSTALEEGTQGRAAVEQDPLQQLLLRVVRSEEDGRALGMLPMSRRSTQQCKEEPLPLLKLQGAGVHVPVHLGTSAGSKVELVQLFQDDSQGFRDATLALFKELLEPRFVEAITYNPVFGKLWRAVCRLGHDNPRRQELVEQMSATVSRCALHMPSTMWIATLHCAGA